MSDVTQILEKFERGDPAATERLLPLVYDELKRMAASQLFAERPDHTLQATALVHEAYLRLVDARQVRQWESRGHFFAAAAEAMRRILVESARRKRSKKRGGEYRRVGGEQLELVATMADEPDLLLDIDAGISRLTDEDPEVAELVKLRLFAGLSITEAGKMLGMPRTQAYKNWQFVRAWFTADRAESLE